MSTHFATSPDNPAWRTDPLTGRRVLISPARGDRPIGLSHCPFCEGHESETTPEVLAFRRADSLSNGPGWRVRVIPNRYAAVRLDATGPEAGLGTAEVFVEGPGHETAFRHLPLEIVTEAFLAWRDRLRFWRHDGRLAFAQVFKNEGAAAGASVAHCHSQLIGVPFVPPRIERERARAGGADCAFCHWLAASRGSGCTVTEADGFAAVCPPAPRAPGETWVLPVEHARDFESLGDQAVAGFARVVRDLLHRVANAFAAPAVNLILQSATFGDGRPFHWRLEVLPRIITGAGWEWATGLEINTIWPETAASLLRGVPGDPEASGR